METLNRTSPSLLLYRWDTTRRQRRKEKRLNRQQANEPTYDKVKAHNHAIILAIVSMLLFSSMLLMPDTGVAADAAQNTVTCSANGSSNCLPAGRWGSYIDEIATRTEPNGGWFGWVSNIAGSLGGTLHTAVPQALLSVMNICWRSALAMTDFASSFTPATKIMKNLDASLATLINNFMAGSLASTFIILAIVGVLVAGSFGRGTTRQAVKQLCATFICIAMLVAMGVGATKDTDTKPGAFSPWWITQNINDTINKLTDGLDFDSLASGDSALMAAKDKGNCQSYLQAMHDDYKTTVSGSKKSGTSIPLTVNRLWEETALRTYVTMQYGSTTASGDDYSNAISANSQTAYCHVLESYAGTDTGIQKKLTNTELHTDIDDKTARWIFSTEGFIDPWNSEVNDDSNAWDRGDDIYRNRMAVFWMTCGDKGQSRPGFAKIVNNLGDDGTDDIKANKQYLRPGVDSAQKKNVYDWSGSLATTGKDVNKAATTVCQAVLPEKDGTKVADFHREKDHNKPGDQKGTNIGDAAMLGWRFDVPTVDVTWNEVNLNLSVANDRAAKESVRHLAGQTKYDIGGEAGSLVGALCNLIVWGLIALVLIVTKLMTLLMGMFLVVAVAMRAFPFFEGPKKALINWAKFQCNLSMVGLIVGALGSVAAYICDVTLSVMDSKSNDFLYQLIAGLSPVLSMIIISYFCSKVVKVGNPFSIKAIADMAGAGALVVGLGSVGKAALRQFGRNRSMRRNMGRELDKRGVHRLDSQNVNGEQGGSAEVLRKASGEQEATAGDGEGKPKHGGLGIRDAFEPEKEKMEHGSGMHGVNKRLHKAVYEGKLRSNDEKYLERVTQGMSEGKASALRHMANGKTKFAHAVGYAARGVGHAGAMAGRAVLAVARNKPLRDVAKGIGTTAAKAGLAAVAFSNPITAPLGLALAAGAVNPFNRANRQNLHTLGTLAGGAAKRVRNAAHDSLLEKATEAAPPRVAYGTPKVVQDIVDTGEMPQQSNMPDDFLNGKGVPGYSNVQPAFSAPDEDGQVSVVNPMTGEAFARVEEGKNFSPENAYFDEKTANAYKETIGADQNQRDHIDYLLKKNDGKVTFKQMRSAMHPTVQERTMKAAQATARHTMAAADYSARAARDASSTRSDVMDMKATLEDMKPKTPTPQPKAAPRPSGGERRRPVGQGDAHPPVTGEREYVSDGLRIT